MLAERYVSQDGKHQRLSEGILSEYVIHGFREPDLGHVTGQGRCVLGKARPALSSHDAGGPALPDAQAQLSNNCTCHFFFSSSIICTSPECGSSGSPLFLNAV